MSYRDYDDFGLGDTPLTAMGGGVEPSNAMTNALGSVTRDRTLAAAGMLGTAMEGASNRQLARMRAEEYARRSKKSGIGGVFSLLGAATGAIPGVGPWLGAGFKAAGGLFG